MSVARVTALAATTAAAAVVLTACSSSGSTGSTAANTPPPAQAGSSGSPAQQATGSGRSVSATETEFHIALSTTKFSPGTWTFHVSNSGSITHALTVDGPGVDKSTSDISPGRSATLTVTLKSGRYEIFCPVGDHKMEGMDEHVTVS